MKYLFCVIDTTNCIALYHEMWLHVATNYMTTRAHKPEITISNFILEQAV